MVHTMNSVSRMQSSYHNWARVTVRVSGLTYARALAAQGIPHEHQRRESRGLNSVQRRELRRRDARYGNCPISF